MKTSILNRRRVVIAFIIFSLLMLMMAFRVGYQQLVKGGEYEKMAVTQQIRDEVLTAKRGNIVDRNGEELAVSSTVYSLWARPKEIASSEDKDENAKNIETTSKTLAKYSDLTEKEITKLISEDKSLVKVDKYIERDVAVKIRKEDLKGISLTEEVKRYYPMGDFASQLLGSVTDDNNGLSGLERQYNNELSGVPGRWVKNTDVGGNPLAYGTEKYFEPQDGNSIVLTIDEVIQSYAEKSVAASMEEYDADKVSCMIMDTETGEILAMASSPGYDPNYPRKPITTADQKAYKKMSSKEQLDYLNEMWRNPLVSDIYEPGSTAKLITAAAALEEGLTSKSDHFYCSGSMTVQGTNVKCWRYYNPHGDETLYQGVGNSCNPVFMTLALRLGVEKYYNYLSLFGITEKTGIDFPGEASSILVPENDVTKLNLAIMGFGQTNAVSALQLITAISAMGNDGDLMEPHLVKEIKDPDGKVIETIEPKKVRTAISKETADEMCDIMEYVVEKGGGEKAQIAGYKVGGKTGTAQKIGDNGYTNEVIASFIGMAPMDDPKITVLYIIDNPADEGHGGVIAAPGAKEVMENVLRYKDIKPTYTKTEKAEESKDSLTVPKLTGMKYSEAVKILENMGLKYKLSPETENPSNYKIVSQDPKSGEKIEKNGIVYLYRK